MANLVLGLLTGIILARSLGPDGRGQIAAILFWPNLMAPIGFMGVNDAVVYAMGKKQIDFRALLSSSITLVIVLSVVVLGLGWWMIPFLIGEARMQFHSLARTYMVVLIPFYYISLTLMAFELGRLQFNRYNLIQLLQTFTYFSTLLMLLVFSIISIQNAVWASVSGVVMVTFVLLIFFKNDFVKTPSLNMCADLLRRGTTFHFTTIVSLISNQLDKLIVIKFLDNLSIGYYVVAYTFASAGLNALAHTAHTILFPIISRGSNLKEKRHALYYGISISIFALSTASVILLIFSDSLLPLLFGEKYSTSVTLSVVLVFACLPLAIRQILVRSLKGMGISRYSTLAEILSLILFVSLVFPLMREYSVLGVGYSLVIANTVSLAYLLWISNLVVNKKKPIDNTI